MATLDVTERVIVPFGSGYEQEPLTVDISERSVVFLGSGVVRRAEPDGIGTAAAFGVAKTVAYVLPTGVVLSATVGTASTSAYMTILPIDGVTTAGTPQVNMQVGATGIASPVTAGEPRVAEAMNPDGIAGAEDVAAPATVAYMQPDSAVSQPSVGTVSVTRKGWMFRTPRTTYQWRMFKEYEGVSLLREGGVWSEVQHPDLERTRSAQIYLGGGRDHFVDTTTKTELVGLGYTVTEEIIP